jgi:hypothetical protein
MKEKGACAGFLRIHEFAEGIKLRRNSAELHAERKCVPGSRLTSLPKLRRDSIFRNADETQSHQDSQKDQRSRPLTLRNSSKSGGSVSSGGIPDNHWIILKWKDRIRKEERRRALTL